MKVEEGEAQLHPLVGFPSPQGCTLQCRNFVANCQTHNLGDEFLCA